MMIYEYIDSLGLPKGKAEAVKAAIEKYSFYRDILYKVGVNPGVIDRIMKVTDITAIDTTETDLMTEKARTEWADFITP